MTHDELLDKIEDIEYWQEQYAGKTFMKAIRAVVELHYPTSVSWASRLDYCMECSNWRGRDPELLRVYPCPTIQAIEKELR